MSTGKSAFRRRPISEAEVMQAQQAVAGVPGVGAYAGGGANIVPLSAPVHENLGSSQESARVTGDAAPFVYSQAVVGGVYIVPQELLTSNPMPPRALYTDQAVDDMGASLVEQGQLTAATGFLNEKGGVTLIEGETRLRATRSRGLPTLRVEIRPKPLNDLDLYKRARSSNVQRNEQTPLDDAIRWSDMLAKNHYASQVALARDLEVGEDVVSRTLKLASLPKLVLNHLVNQPDLLNLKMLNAIREFWEAKGDDETLVLIFEVAKSGLGYRDVMARRKAAEKGPVKRPRAHSEPFRFNGVKGELKSFEQGGRVELVIQNLADADRDALLTKLKTLFQMDQEEVGA